MHGRWNVKASGAGFVTRFAVKAEYLSRFPVQTVGGAKHTEYWVPAADCSQFDRVYENPFGLGAVSRELNEGRALRMRLPKAAVRRRCA